MRPPLLLLVKRNTPTYVIWIYTKFPSIYISMIIVTSHFKFTMAYMETYVNMLLQLFAWWNIPPFGWVFVKYVKTLMSTRETGLNNIVHKNN